MDFFAWVGFAIQFLSFLVQIGSMIFFAIMLCVRRRTHLKYKIKHELIGLCVCWILLIVVGCFYLAQLECSIQISNYIQ